MIDVNLTVTVSPVIDVTVETTGGVVTAITEQVTVVTSSELSFSQLAQYVTYAPQGTMVSQTVQDAITELSENLFQQGTEPTTGVNEGDLWFDTTNDKLMVYSTISGVSTWEEVIMQNQGTVDGGEF
jgi:hypothetical protein